MLKKHFCKSVFIIFAKKEMERLYQISNNAIANAPDSFKRFIFDEIDLSQRMIGISGARGSGKTILLVQILKQIHKETNALYTSLDDLYFSEKKLLYFAEDFYKNGGKVLLLDEVHRYKNWSQELKNIYDSIPGLKIIFTSSSALDIYKGTHDLSRRAVIYHLPGLSFREYLLLGHGIDFPVLTLEKVLYDNTEFCFKINSQFRPIVLFDEYLMHGYYPFFKETGSSYLRQLNNTVNLAIEVDLAAIHNIDYHSIIKIKKMLSVLSRIVPYKPNIEHLAKQIGTTRDTLLKYLYYLEKAQILKWLGRDSFGINYLNKPDKLYLNNTNLAYALGVQQPDIGNLRETFFLNQLSVKHVVSYPEKGDFRVNDKYLFEVGGKSKTQKQIKGEENAFIVADDIEYAFGNKIPLWLFGFLY
jgi:predicted AAA+ superfamily ATPase